MKSRKLYLRSVEVMLGLIKIDDIVDFDIRGIIRSGIEQMESQNGEMNKMMKECPYELKLAMMKFHENAADLAEAQYGPYFTAGQFQESILKILNGNPLNMMAMLNKNNIIKN
jgi:DNA phosphorothioation-dependent restriction protein DptG